MHYNGHVCHVLICLVATDCINIRQGAFTDIVKRVHFFQSHLRKPKEYEDACHVNLIPINNVTTAHKKNEQHRWVHNYGEQGGITAEAKGENDKE